MGQIAQILRLSYSTYKIPKIYEIVFTILQSFRNHPQPPPCNGNDIEIFQEALRHLENKRLEVLYISSKIPDWLYEHDSEHECKVYTLLNPSDPPEIN